ncbi:Chromatin assembly factor 1 subunit A family protein [Cryptosporidium meleagridis]|uniref:Chromatin assembly factor 1 subunit A family protein n=1 Tax=Cryptosporidium meleagridis TaxID=93969 RepID=A0A2P4YW95_9CRYT|nr:Chromatin assembly factor 1 subunit A family protein [Cryptosporidium meleagridis]
MIEENYSNFSKRGDIENLIGTLDIETIQDRENSSEISNKHIRKDSHKVIPFEYGNGYGYLYTRLKWILDNNEISGQFKNEMYSLLETIGELRVLGVYNEPYKKYRKAFDIFSMKFDSYSEYNENVIGDLRYQCYQSSSSGRKELKIIDRCIKEWSKRDRENKLLHSYRDAMSEWLNKSELGVNKMEPKAINSENIFKEIINYSKDTNNPLQQSQILSFLSLSYISEKLFPFIPGQLANNTSSGTFSCGVIGDTIRFETQNPNGSISSIELVNENAIEDADIIVEEKQNPLRTDFALEAIQKSNESSLNSLRIHKNESVMSWIKSNSIRRQDTNSEKPEQIYDNIREERKKQLASDKEKILSQRLTRSLHDIDKDISNSSLNKDFILKEYFTDYFSIYKLFISTRENLYNQREYYKSIPIVGSIRYKKQKIDLEEVRARQFQSIYNDGIHCELVSKIRRVLIYRSEWKRPPMYLLITHKGRNCKGNYPLAKEDNINYDIDTDEEWEEQFGGEDVENVDDIPDVYEEDDDDAVASGWLVPDGCFQSDELLDEFTIGNSINDHRANIVNLLSLSSQYPSPVVVSFLNHTSVDFGVGISTPNEEYVNSILKGYLINLTQDISWIYNKTDISRFYLSITPDESNFQPSNISEISNARKNVLDLQFKQDLSYFIHGKWASIKKLVDDFFEINNYKDIKKASVVHFIKENVRKAKLTGDAKFRWYVNENSADLGLDPGKLSELLAQRRAEEKNLSNKVELTKITQNRACLQSDIGSPSLKSQIKNSGDYQNFNGKGKQPESRQCSNGIDPEYYINQKIVSENDENNNINSQCSLKSTDYVLNYISSSQGSERSSINSQVIEKETHTGTVYNKKRKFSTPTRNVPDYHSNYPSFNRKRDADETDGIGSIRASTPESKKSHAYLYNNSLITHFFPPKAKG